jgi:molecular chaperone GrpE
MEQDRERRLDVEGGAGTPAASPRGGAGEAEPAPRSEPAADDLGALSPEELKGKIREAREEAQRNWQHFLHSAADLENYKKQAARDRQDAVERTRRQMLSLVLNVVDNLERALAFGDAQEGAGKSLVDGLRMTHRQILAQLEAMGVRPIAALGERFDPRLHEAVSVVTPQPGQDSGTIVGETLKGYLLNDDVLRPARVAVAGEAAEAQRRDGTNG